ncbi:MAG: hypothetical protein JHC88_13865, partial [Niveispirillum sp.]|nr:hypothetical protein [Niveispirillum sp.]
LLGSRESTPPLPPQCPPVLIRTSPPPIAVNAATSETVTRIGPIRYPSADRVLGRCLEVDGEWLEDEVEVCARALEAGDTVVEVGAGIGLHALTLCKQFAVNAFEPEPRLLEAMLWNIAQHNRGTLKVHEGDGTDIDALALGRLHLIKVSIDHLVLRVLEGAQASIHRHRPCLYLRSQSAGPEAGLMERLQELNYRVWRHQLPLHRVANFKGNSIDPFPGVGVCNLICVPAGRQAVMQGLARLL